MFKTEKRNWGIRTLSDIAQGAFVCIYVGKLFTNEEANEEGQNYGDEYFAELDMIETVEKQKEVGSIFALYSFAKSPNFCRRASNLWQCKQRLNHYGFGLKSRIVRFQGYESDISFDGDDEDCQILSPYESEESNPSTEDEDPRDVKKVTGN